MIVCGATHVSPNTAVLSADGRSDYLRWRDFYGLVFRGGYPEARGGEATLQPDDHRGMESGVAGFSLEGGAEGDGDAADTAAAEVD